MKIFIVDISWKIPLYDIALADAIGKTDRQDNQVYVCVPKVSGKDRSFNVVKLLGNKEKSYSKWLRSLLLIKKTAKALLNYLVLGWHVRKKKPDILHIEWFPMLDYVGVEIKILRLLKRLDPSMKVVYTIHNVYPHDMNLAKKEAYRKRFLRISSLIDTFVVHTNSTKEDVVHQFNIPSENISVIPHGIFKMKKQEQHTRIVSDDKVCFIMYGNMTSYKGVDIMVEAMALLPEEYKKRIKVTIVGRIDESFYNKLKAVPTGVETKWMPYYVNDDTLCQEIVNADVIMVPYRAISQSGVLLLALSFGKVILTSDLPSFRETLEGYDDNMFFESGNANSLASLIVNYLDGKIDVDKAKNAIKQLNVKYSWDEVARLTCFLYRNTLIKK